MATRRTNLEITEVSLCKKGANPGAKVVLAKSSTESEMTEVETLQKQVADLTAECDAQKAEIEKLKNPETPAEDPLEKAAPEIKELLAKAQAAADAAVADAKKNADALAKMQKETLEKSLDSRLALMKTTFSGEADRKTITKHLMELGDEAREAVMKSLERAEVLAAKGLDKASGEVGDSQASGELTAAQEIEKKAKDIVDKDRCSIQKARTIVRDLNPELAERERAESKESK